MGFAFDGETMRRWRGRVGVVAAAFASLATSQPGWSVRAPVNEVRVPHGKAIRYVIAASEEPLVTVTIELPVVDPGTPPEPSASEVPWSEGREFVLFEGEKLESAEVGGTCEGGGGCDECEGPPGAYVTVEKEMHTSWEATASADVHLEVDLDSCHGSNSEATIASVLVNASAPETAKLWFFAERETQRRPELSVTPDGDAYLLRFDPISNRFPDWRITVRARGICPTDAPCEPPPISLAAANAKICE